MLLIAHRGNVYGPSQFENTPEHIQRALSMGFDVEVDVWRVGERWMTGHDSPAHEVSDDFVRLTRLWLHAKNIEALTELSKRRLNCFFHDRDDYTVTSWGRIWAYPGKRLVGKGIAVMFENGVPPFPCEGICSDFVASLVGGTDNF